jgi:hypothetical protein
MIFINIQQTISNMKPEYKVKVNDVITAVQARVRLIDKMIDGQKKADPREAKIFIKEIENGLEKIAEFISIS